MSKDNYKVYVHINKINGKRYYGITKQKVEERWKNGMGYKGQFFFNEIVAYGWNNFEHIVLFDSLTKEEAELMEQMYIALYDTTNEEKGYNISFGGKSVFTSEYNPNAKQIYCVELDKYFDTITEASEYVGCTRSSLGKCLNEKYSNNKTAGGYHWLYAEDVNQENINRVMSQEYNKNSKDFSNNGRKIYCVELDMYFDSQIEATNFIGCKSGNLYDVLNGNTKTACGYHWIYADIEDFEEKVNEAMSERVYCIELDKYFNNAKDCAEFIGCTSSNISTVLRGITKTAKGYHFLYAKDVNEENINRVMNEKSNNNIDNAKKVYCIELDKTFNSINEASRFINRSSNGIRDCLKGKQIICGGYHWIYAKDKDNKEKIELLLSEKYNKNSNKYSIEKYNNNPKKVYIVELDKYFDTIKDCAKFINVNRSNLSKAIKQNKPYKGYHVIYAEDLEIENNKVS